MKIFKELKEFGVVEWFWVALLLIALIDYLSW